MIVESDDETDTDLAVRAAVSAAPGALKGIAAGDGGLEWSRERELHQDGSVRMTFRAGVSRSGQ